MDESRRIKARVFIPLHDLEYDVEFYSMLETPPTADLHQSMSELQEALSDVEPFVGEEDTDSALQVRRDTEQLEAEFERLSAGELGKAEHVAHMLAESKARVRDLQLKYGMTAKYNEVLEHLGWAERMAEEHSDSLGLAAVQDLRQDGERCLRLDDQKGLDSVDRRAMEIFWEHYVKTDECWIGLVEYLRDQRRFSGDQIAFDEYLKRAEDCLARRDFEGTRLNGWQARSYLPDSRAKENRFWDTIIAAA
jgi:hypothetical protein